MMIKRIVKKCNINSSSSIIAFAGAVIGAIVFCAFYGVRVLDFTYDGWIYDQGIYDIGQHYLGWRFFRREPWSFPNIGMIRGMVYPYETNILYTDSIPLFAVFFKVIRRILPSTFQYFGLYGLLCFMLQGLLATRIISLFQKNKYLVLAGTALVCLEPCMMFRMFRMTSLASHFLLLLAMWLQISPKLKNAKNKYSCLLMLCFGALCASIHFYFVPICGIVLMAGWTYKSVITKKVINYALECVSYLLGAVGIVWILGGFTSQTSAVKGGLYAFGANINCLYNSHDISSILADHYSVGKQVESVAYLGVGVLFLVICSILLLSEIDRKKWIIVAIYTIWGIVAFVLAIGPRVTYNDVVLVEYNLPDFIYKLWSIFRGTGRFAFVCVILIVVGSIFIVSNADNQRLTTKIIVFALILQLVDLRGYQNFLYDRFAHASNYYNLLDSCHIEGVGNVSHMVIPRNALPHDYLYALGDFAIDNNLTTSNFYLARENEIAEADELHFYNNLETADYQDDILYVIDESQMESFSMKEDLNVYKCDRLYFVCTKKHQLIGMEEVTEFN